MIHFKATVVDVQGLTQLQTTNCSSSSNSSLNDVKTNVRIKVTFETAAAAIPDEDNENQTHTQILHNVFSKPINVSQQETVDCSFAKASILLPAIDPQKLKLPSKNTVSSHEYTNSLTTSSSEEQPFVDSSKAYNVTLFVNVQDASGSTLEYKLGTAVMSIEDALKEDKGRIMVLPILPFLSENNIEVVTPDRSIAKSKNGRWRSKMGKMKKFLPSRSSSDSLSEYQQNKFGSSSMFKIAHGGLLRIQLKRVGSFQQAPTHQEYLQNLKQLSSQFTYEENRNNGYNQRNYAHVRSARKDHNYQPRRESVMPEEGRSSPPNLFDSIHSMITLACGTRDEPKQYYGQQHQYEENSRDYSVEDSAFCGSEAEWSWAQEHEDDVSMLTDPTIDISYMGEQVTQDESVYFTPSRR